MLSRIQAFIDRLQLDTSRAPLGVWIALINVAIVVLVVGGISISAIGSLRDLANQQGSSRVQLAGAMAREDLRRYGEDALTQAKSVADRQTLQRMMADARSASLGLYLRRSCNNDTIVACAVFESDQLVAQAGVSLPWGEIAAAGAEQGERFLVAPSVGRYALLGASAQIGGAVGRRLYVARLLDERMAQVLSERVGTPIRLINYRMFVEDKRVDDFTRLHSAGLSDGRSAVLRIGDLDLYAASFPVFASTGEAIALLEARLPSGEIDASVGSLVRRLIVTAIVLAAIAVLAGVILGQQVTGPLGTLSDAVGKLGQGDFSTSIPAGGTKEVGNLGRCRLLDQLVGRCQLLDHAATHDGDVVGQRQRFAMIVGDIDCRQAERRDQLGQFAHHVLAQFAIEIGQRLVEENELRFGNDRSRDRNTLLLPTREIARPAVSIGAEADAF